MDSGKLVIFCIFGVLGSAFLGYCVYFDRKRRNDPDYKRKVLKRRKSMTQNSKVIDMSTPKARDEFLQAQFELANQMLMEGNMEASINHFINFVYFSSNPKVALAALQQILPPAIFKAVVQSFVAKVQSSNEAVTKEDVD